MPRPAAIGGIQLNVGVVKVPDERLDRLAEIFKPKKIVHADVTYVDLPAPPASTEGRVGTEELPARAPRPAARLGRAAPRRPGLGRRCPSRTRPARSIRLATSSGSTSSSSWPTSRSSIGGSSGCGRAGATARRPSARRTSAKRWSFGGSRRPWRPARPIRDIALEPDEEKAIRGFRFLTQKPVLVLLNVGEADLPRSRERRGRGRGGLRPRARARRRALRQDRDGARRAGAGRGGGVHGGARASRSRASTGSSR